MAGPRLDERVAARWAVPEARRLADSLADRVRANVPDAKVWITQRDERVRKTHVKADTQTIPDNLRYILNHPAHADHEADGAGFDPGTQELAAKPRDPELSIGNRINCFPGWVTVEAAGIQASIRARYRGPLVYLWTASGGYLACTPNHPLLTDRGWVAAGRLEVGDHLIKAGIGELRQAGDLPVEPHVEHEPPALCEVHGAFTQAGLPQRVPRGAVDLYGDPLDGDVEVVRPDGQLLLDGVAPSTQRISELGLAVPDLADAGPGLRRALSVRCSTAASGLVGRARQLLAALRRGVAHAHPHGGAAVARLDSGRQQQSADREAADTVRTGQRLLTLPGGVATDELVDVYVRDWAGHVYTLSTDIGAYTVAGGYVAANCRCITAELPRLIAEHVHASDVVLAQARARALVVVEFARIVESEHPGAGDGGGGWLRRSIEETVLGRGSR